jgi:pimeloyl-ACP methyl ester carboxylesterase
MRLFFLILVLFGFSCMNVASASNSQIVALDAVQTPALWTQRFVDNAGVRIEYRVREATGAGVNLAPIVFIPGMTGSASIWANNHALVGALDVTASRKLIAVSLRGRGASDCPEKGWTPRDHHSDIAAVIRAEKLASYHLIAHSMGVAYGVGFALSRPQKEILSFVAGDYFPAIMQVNEEWAQMVESNAPPLSYDPRLARHILREQGAPDYAERLNELTMPMLIILGRKSMDHPRVESMYAKAPNHRIMWIDHGHMVFSNAEAIAVTATHLSKAKGK